MLMTAEQQPTVTAIIEPRLDAAGTITWIAVLGAGLAAGFFVTYSISVMPGLARLDDAGFVATMRAINDTVRTGWFLAFFAGTAPAAIAAAIAFRRHSARAATLAALAAGIYVVGVLIVTFAGNVPLNEELATVRISSAAAAGAARDDFEDQWNRLNLVRALSSLVTFGVLAATLKASRTPDRP